MNNFIGFIKNVSLGTIALAFCFCSFGQHSENTILYNKLISIEDTSLGTKEKIPLVYILKKQFEGQKLSEDSVYARILHRIGAYEFIINKGIATKNAIIFTLKAIRINRTGKKNTAPALCVNSYTNLGRYYASFQMYDVAARYYDSAIILKKRFKVPVINEVDLLLAKGQMLYNTGDYQKAIEEFNVAILKAKTDKDTSRLPGVLIQRAKSYIGIRRLEEALVDVTAASELSKIFKDTIEIINGMFIKADILAQNKDFSEALTLYKKGIEARLRTNDSVRIANDYIKLGYFYVKNVHDYTKAKQCFFTAIPYGKKTHDREILALINLNLGAVSVYQHNYNDAERYYFKALQDLKVSESSNVLINYSSTQLSAAGNKEILLFILTNKTELLLKQFIESNDNKYLSACLQMASLTDTIITNIRHEQLGEQSKLYWRDRTREFFTHAIEASWLANNARLAFHFMEKSRAALLNDKLNELRASSLLPEAESGKELELRIAAISEQQKLAAYKSDESGSEVQQLKLLQAKADLERYVKSLEKKYPAYYQSKYADDVPSLETLQKQLLENKKSFVHYFMNDTVAYILGITYASTKMVKLSRVDFNSGQLTNFLQLCSNVPALNNQYVAFATLSNALYKLLFQPLSIPKGRVVISPDNFLIPFEALCSDSTGNNFLVRDYVFSYVYSARFLFRSFKSYEAKGDYIGFAPVSFKAYPNVADLKQSGNALKQSGRYYNNTELFVNSHASRHNFINAISGYTVVNVFSHAMADTTENEPVLYMHDSVIYLSELQLLHNPATNLVVLSACQTNIGKSAKGEGILSLARGFSSAGIPSVAATLWKADEQAIYAISEKFHEYLSQGMPKDEALQKAKLYFIENDGTEMPFPYYWANMILVGNLDPIKLSENYHIWPWIAGIIFISAVILLTVKFLKKRSAGQ